MALLKRVFDSRPFQKSVGVVGTEWLRLVWSTNRITIEPAGIHEQLKPHVPVILAMWHGQHFLVPFIRGPYQAKVLISRHRDGEINAIAAERLGVGTIRGSGSHGGEFARKGGVVAFKQMLDALAEGYSLGVTADIPKVSRVAGLGIVMLARDSGRPILPIAMTTSRRKQLDNWDRTTINLPFGRCAAVAGDLIRVPADADKATLESARRDVEDRLNAATARAEEMVGRPETRR
ncbi:MAG: lysophospholipid acyltransferase family protein [Xanthobacteraceae bacterium]